MTISELQKICHRGAGLVIGSEATAYSLVEDDCCRFLSENLGLQSNYDGKSSLQQFTEKILFENKSLDSQVRTLARTYFTERTSINPAVRQLVKADWSAVISLSMDDFFRRIYDDHRLTKISAWNLATVNDQTTILQPGTTPYFPLLGDIQSIVPSSQVALADSEYLEKRRFWTAILKASLVDTLAGDPLIFVGTRNSLQRVADLLVALLDLVPKRPVDLVFLSGDDSPRQPSLGALLGRHFNVHIFQGDISDLSTAISTEAIASLRFPTTGTKRQLVFSSDDWETISTQFSIVPRKENVIVDPSQRNRLLDSLFRPLLVDWGPFAAHFDFVRDVSTVVYNDVERRLADPSVGRIVMLRGEAGVGKTTLLKSVAFAFAQLDDTICLWWKKSIAHAAGEDLKDIMRCVTKAARDGGRRVVFIADDPVGSHNNLQDLISRLRGASFNYVIIVCNRKSDYLFSSDGGYSSSTESGHEFEVSSELSTAEIRRLPTYLVKLNIAANEHQAGQIIGDVANARDVVCAFWYLLPSTKAAISESISEEYSRINGIGSYITNVAQSVPTNSIAAKAYEYVGCCSSLGDTALPVEVLVSALGQSKLLNSFQEWLSQCKEGSPLWGLIYSAPTTNRGSECYRTRNEVVTRILINIINFGSGNRAREYLLLKELLSSCTSTGETYSIFLEDVLIRQRKYLESRFSYEQVMELFRVATAAFPLPYDRLRHHKCIAKKNMGGDLIEVYEELTRLIGHGDNPADPRRDRSSLVHNTAASTLVKAIEAGQEDPTTGAKKIETHVNVILLGNAVDIPAHHVYANSFLKIGSKVKATDKSAYLYCIEKGMRIIDRVYTLVKPNSQVDPHVVEDLTAFNRLKEEAMVALGDLEQIKRIGEELFVQTNSQVGLVLSARTLISQAVFKNFNGTLFKKADDYVRHVNSLISNRGQKPSIEFLLCRVELEIKWKIMQGRGQVYWDLFAKDLKAITEDSVQSNDPTLIFYLAVACFQLKLVPTGETLFQQLRRRNLSGDMKAPLRCVYLDDEGKMKCFEGKISSTEHEKIYVTCDQLGTEILVRSAAFRALPKNTSVKYAVGFSMNGPYALAETFDIRELGKI